MAWYINIVNCQNKGNQKCPFSRFIIAHRRRRKHHNYQHFTTITDYTATKDTTATNTITTIGVTKPPKDITTQTSLLSQQHHHNFQFNILHHRTRGKEKINCKCLGLLNSAIFTCCLFFYYYCLFPVKVFFENADFCTYTHLLNNTRITKFWLKLSISVWSRLALQCLRLCYTKNGAI